MSASVPIETLKSWIAKLEMQGSQLTGELEDLTGRMKEVREHLKANNTCLQKMNEILAQFMDDEECWLLAAFEEEEEEGSQ